jgi:UDP-glucuronate 4-epimerase
MRRDFTHVDDIVAGILGALKHPPVRDEQGAALRVLNLGRGEPVDLMRFIELIELSVGQPLRREYTDMQAGDMVETYADTSAARQLFGYAPAISLEAGVPPLVDWCRSYFAD